MTRLGLAALVLLTACGGSPEAAPAPTPTKTQEIVKGSTLAARIQCQLYERDSTSTELYVLEAGSCVFGQNDPEPTRVEVRTFVTNETRDQWLAVAKTFAGPFAVGDRAVVYGEVPEVAQTAAPLFDAEVR